MRFEILAFPHFQPRIPDQLSRSIDCRRLVFGSATKLYTCPLDGIFYEDPPVDDALCDFTEVLRYHNIHIVGSCNGLVCLVNLHTGHIFVWNPAIRKYKKLPFPLRFSSRESYRFCYDASSDDYKVVHIIKEPNSRPYSRTYSLRNDSWKSSDWSHGRTPFARSGVFLNGAIHWLVGYNDNGAKVRAVVAQSLATGELLWSVALPLQSRASLQVLGERLCACFQGDMQIEVWVMEEYGVQKSWSKVFCLDDEFGSRKPLLVTEKGFTQFTILCFFSLFLKNNGSNPFENLPQDLIIDILSRLSVKSLLRLRCVAKSWLSLISSPEFETNYLEVSTTRRPRLVFGSATKLYTCPFNGIENPPVDDVPCDFTEVRQYHNIHIVGSCNGLVCLVNQNTGHIFLWNPAIRKYRKLPFPLWLSSREPYGFFYDASSDDYKVVHKVEEPDSKPYSRTYSLRNDSWKSLDWSHGRTPIGGSCVFLNGAIHWIVGYNDNGSKAMAVEAQSLATGELFWSVALPSKRWAFLQVLGEHLCACFECYFRIEVWVMKEYGVEKSWSKVFCLYEPRLRRRPSFFFEKWRRPLFVTEKGVVTTKTFKRSISYIFLENEDVLRGLECKYVTATTYGESLVNPNKTW
ncbi:uncharacterized protein [Primulina eburnea]|uniref:uncharacterized protein n=1 Tax=Primulina eburnea TaxID=1245227 RepID=UPI003C6BF1BA